MRKGSEIAVSQHTLHRDPRWYPNPGQFDPDRWDLVPVAGQRVYAQVKATMQPNRLPMTATSRRPQA
ncbi:cytochrome P450 [Lentzea rhizosphaerae]